MAIIDKDSEFLASLDYNNLTDAQQQLVESLIIVAQELIELECNRKFALTTYTDQVYDGNGRSSIFVKNPPIASLTDIDIISTNAGEDDEETTYDDTYFDYDSLTGEIHWKPNDFTSETDGLFPDGFQNIKITYSGGFDSGDTRIFPIKHLIAQAVIELYEPSFNNDIIAAETIGQYSYRKVSNYMDKMLLSKKKILNMYKIHYVQ